jgi:hypothetical protein
MIIQVENAVSEADCHLLTTIYDRQCRLAKVTDHTGHAVVYWAELRDAPFAAEIVPRLVEECLCHITSQLRPADFLYPETVILTVLGAGGYHSRHADNCRQNEQGDWVANHTPSATCRRSIISMTSSKAARSPSSERNWWSSRAAGSSWPFPATLPIFTRFFRCAAASDTRCRSGSPSSNASNCQ